MTQRFKVTAIHGRERESGLFPGCATRRGGLGACTCFYQCLHPWWGGEVAWPSPPPPGVLLCRSLGGFASSPSSCVRLKSVLR